MPRGSQATNHSESPKEDKEQRQLNNNIVRHVLASGVPHLVPRQRSRVLLETLPIFHPFHGEKEVGSTSDLPNTAYRRWEKALPTFFDFFRRVMPLCRSTQFTDLACLGPTHDVGSSGRHNLSIDQSQSLQKRARHAAGLVRTPFSIVAMSVFYLATNSAHPFAAHVGPL